MRSLLPFLLSPALFLPAFSGEVSDSFDSTAPGALPNPPWSESFNQGGNGDQHQLFTVANGAGRQGSRGIAGETGTLRSSYRVVHATALTAREFTVSVDFQLSITHVPPSEANHALFGVFLSTGSEWWEVNSNNNTVAFNLLRRGEGTRFGSNGIGDGAEEASWKATGWEPQHVLGLPGSLPNPGETASSDWATLELILKHHSGNQWDSTGRVRNSAGEVIYAITTARRTTFAWDGEQTLHAGIAVPWVESNDFHVLAAGGVSNLSLDNFRFSTPGEVVSNALPPHGLTLHPATDDQDGNGLPDLWEALAGSFTLSPEADSDGDGYTNAQEALAGTDPLDDASLFSASLSSAPSSLLLSWPDLFQRTSAVESSLDLGANGDWQDYPGQAIREEGLWQLAITDNEPRQFFRVSTLAKDDDGDGLPDWMEPALGFSFQNQGNQSAGGPKSYDTDGDGSPDVTLSGDLAALNEIYRRPEEGKALTEAQAARLLLQGTFGPASLSEVQRVAAMGADVWLSEQLAQPPSLTQPYLDAIKADLASGQSDDKLAGYYVNGGGGGSPFISGTNFMTAWLRATLQGPDQLRQRVAFALSQILVASRDGTGLANQGRATAHYYDHLVKGAFGNYEDLLLTISLSPYMGHYLSHLGNQKADPAIGRYPDENYAREIMQLFSIGLWELHPDGTRRLDANGEPIATYGNYEITEVAKVFTGVNYAANNFGGGWRDDGDSNDQWMTTPMKIFASHHDFTPKQVPFGLSPAGERHYQTIPARAATDENARQDVQDLVHHLVHHPNCAPFVSRQLIQFLVTSNPSPAYVARVAAVFSDDGTGTTGNLAAVVRALLLDPEARDPLQHLATAHFGQFREPTVRTVHLMRLLQLDRHRDILWWDWGYYADQSLQEPMRAPSVFNFYRPDFRLFGPLAERQLDSPALGIVNSYSSVSFPNYLWKICQEGVEHPNGDRFYADKTFPPDLAPFTALAPDIPALLDRLSLLVCGGTLSAESRATISEVLASEPNLENRARLALFLTLNSPEGSCLK
ncbi:DUF1800 family protein [Roseibacillus ishigakijimensis]|uniref:DUF1800 domain-containing protein n=1 Tax=Roseibacillus ishigakijimensis TaxID=454146 RepID=A0A934RN29_9BACT|nr:DUF1800 family protein [Roseibacillus ishigakijimensis]MBK1832692.1 DUF1800 domain-containing protein [Roseibacillus ishigakijimensis]